MKITTDHTVIILERIVALPDEQSVPIRAQISWVTEQVTNRSGHAGGGVSPEVIKHSEIRGLTGNARPHACWVGCLLPR